MPSLTGSHVRRWVLRSLGAVPRRRLGRFAAGLGLSLCAAGAGAQTLSVGLTANPSMGTAPLNGVDVTADVNATPPGSITYTFYCHRADAGTDVTAGYALQRTVDETSTNATFTASDLCSYAAAGTYTAKVIVERGGQKAEARIEVVAAGSTLGASTQSLYYVGDSGQTLYRSSMEGAGAVPIMEPPLAGTSLHLVAVSNNGRWIAFTHSYGDVGELWVVNLDGSDPHKITDAPWATQVLWFPGDEQIGFRAASIGGGEDGAFYRVPRSGGTPTQWISPTSFAAFGKNCIGKLSLSKIGSRFAASAGICSAGEYVSFVGTIDVATGTLSNIRQVSPSSSGNWDRVSGEAVITPDGETVFYTRREMLTWFPPTALGEIRRVSFDGSGEQVIWSPPQLAYGPGSLLLSPDGLRLFFTRDALTPEVFASMKLDGSDYQEHAVGLGNKDFGPAPVNVYYVSDGELWRARADGEAPTQVLVSPSPTKPITSLRVTDDGERVAFTIGSKGLDDELWTAKTDGTDLRQVVEAPSASSPVWLPSKTEVGFRAALSQDLGAYYRAPVGGGAASPWVSSSAFAAFGRNCLGPLALSGDASRFAAPVGLCAGDDHVVLAGNLDATSGAVLSLRQLSPASSGSTRTSSSALLTRDGTTVFYSWRDDSVPQGQIRRLGFDGSGEQVIWSAAATGGPGTLRLWPDGSRLWFLKGPADAQGRYRLSSVGLDGAEPRDHFETTGEFDFGPGPGAVAATRATFVAFKEQSAAGLESQAGIRPVLRLVTGDGQPTTEEVTAHYQTRDGTAVAEEDYLPVAGTVTFPAGTKSGTEVPLLTVVFVDDSHSEGPETLTVEITTLSSALVGSPASLTITIRDDDVTGYEWPAAGSMGTRRGGHTTTLLRDGTVLAAGGRNASGVIATSETFDPATGEWTAAESMTVARHAHSATLLPDGRVLVVGGWGAPEASALLSAEAYDPATRRWTAVSPLHVARAGHTATLLTSGHVLVAGGRGDTGVAASAEEYDPETDIWSLTTGPLHDAREGHTATLLADGQVLVAGGRLANGHPTGVSEVYAPGTGTWHLVGAMSGARAGHQATLLPGGTVLAFGGRNDGLDLDSAEEYDATTGIWTAARPMPVPPGDGASSALLPDGRVFSAGETAAQIYDPATRAWTRAQGTSVSSAAHSVTLLPSGRVLVSGGESGGYLALAQVFDPSRDEWRGVGSMTAVAGHSRAVALPTGRVLVVGGCGSSAPAPAETFDPASGTWAPAGASRTGHGASFTLLPNGKVLAAGGDCRGAQHIAELYDPAASSWTATGSLAAARFDHSATLLPDGRVLVAGGQDGASPLASTEIFDPATGAWTAGQPLGQARYGHTATLLGSGRVLVTGGVGVSTPLASSELYDPLAGSWSPTGSLGNARLGHTATLLPSGRVLVAGGGSALAEQYDAGSGRWLDTGRLAIDRLDASATLLPGGQVLLAGGVDYLGNYLAPAELYEPATGVWRPAAVLREARSGHAAALLPDGRVLLAGGYRATLELKSAEVYVSGLVRDDRRPAIASAPSSLAYGVPATVSGTGFHSDSESAGGTSASAAVNFPLVQIRSLESGRLHWLSAIPRSTAWTWGGPETLDLGDLPDALDRGWYALSVYAAGVPSLPRLAQASCGLAVLKPPLDAVVAVGDRATFTVVVEGAREYQWLKDGSAIPGANRPTYTSPPVSPSDTGTTYRVLVRGGCGTETTPAAVLRIEDHTLPTAAVVSPSGGEYWLLSPESGPPNETVVTWSMSDDVRICRVEADILASTDGSANYARVPATAGLDPSKPGGTASFGPGGACVLADQVTTTSARYTVPAAFPVASGSLYKVEVRVTDHAGNTRIVRSANPFYLVKANADSVRTLILKNTARMVSLGVATAEGGAEIDRKLQELAAHPRVLGAVIDLSAVSCLSSLYSAWDAAPGDALKANSVLFGSDPPPGGCSADTNGVHSYLRQALRAYTGAKHVVIVGDDRIVPLARVSDGATLLPESTYTAGLEPDLTPTGSTVGRALAANRFLSDDPLGVLDAVSPAILLDSPNVPRGPFIPDLSVGRLVETPTEIVKAAATFISQDGVLDLSDASWAERKVLVTGYDFLVDTAGQVRSDWKGALGVSTPDGSVAPVDGALVGSDWGLGDVAQRRAALRTHLAGNGGTSYGVSMLLGHADHYEEGVPGQNPTEIAGLSSADMYGEDACKTPSQGALALEGGAVFAIGCHGGLPVPGRCRTDADHSLDLPQTFLSRGVQAYVSNTGYGWGLRYGVGYAERLLQLLTEELTTGGTVAVGDAVKRTKLRYYLETPRYDPYDEKTIMQWALFGLPMYAVKTGIASGDAASAAAFSGRAAEASPQARGRRFGAVEVTESASEGFSPSLGEALPAFLTRLDLRFDFTALGVYRKKTASGGDITGTAGCPDPNGCYYTLNGLVERSTGAGDLPIQPYFIYDSRLSGTSQHGVLWKGGEYEEESGWTPVIGELVSNGGDASNHGSTPRTATIKPIAPRVVGGEDDLDRCRPSDLEMNSLVVTAGEAVKAQESDPQYTIERRYRTVDLEALYFDDTREGSHANCEREGPVLSTGPHHVVGGADVTFSVGATDPQGVWRVLVVWTDNTVDAQHVGRWQPLELAYDGASQLWKGHVTVTQGSRLTYVVQAADRRGNVSWADFEGVYPSSGVPLGLPRTVDVGVAPSAAPTVTGFAPTAAPVGAELTVEGTGFVGVTAVTVGGVSTTFAVASTTSLKALVPYGAVVGPITVTTPFGTATSASLFTPTSLALADVSVVKHGPASATRGEHIRWAVTAANAGPDVALGLVLTDSLPAGVTSATWTCVASTGSTCTGSGSESILDTVTLLSGGTATYTIEATVAADAPGTLANTATLTPPAWVTDPVPGDHEATATTSVSVESSGFFYTVPPCRLVDTRLEGPILTAGTQRDFPVAGRCLVPSGAVAVAATVTVTAPTAPGYVELWASGTPEPNIPMVYYTAGLTRANNAIIGLGADGELSAIARPSGQVHLVVDVAGYFQ
jgi:uncharacterized repeat protein (TIGR01451 family)